MRQPDIEIYLKDADQPAVTDWLTQALGTCSQWRQQGQTYKCQVEHNGTAIPVTWMPKAVGKWNSLLLESDATPWEDDLGCAKAAAEALAVEVRCAPGSWDEAQGEEDADRWMKVTSAGIEEIVWRT
jgi:hypothetical protein